MSFELLLAKLTSPVPQAGFRKLNRPSFFVGKKGGKKPPKSHATLYAAPAPSRFIGMANPPLW